jgi:hypothetical protein
MTEEKENVVPNEVQERMPLEKVENEPFFKTNLLTFVSPRFCLGSPGDGLTSPFQLANSTKAFDGFSNFHETFEGYIELANAYLHHPEVSPKLPSAIFRLDDLY